MDQKEKSTFSWFSSSWFSRCKIQLHVLVSSTALALLIIVLAICLTTLSIGSLSSVLKAVDLVAFESVVHTTQILEAGFKRSTSAVAGAANAAKIFPNPFFYNETTEPEKSKFVLDSWRSLLFRYGSLFREETGLNLRFAKNSAVAFPSMHSIGVVKQSLCTTPYKKFSDAPSSVRLGFDHLTCKVIAYNRTTLQPLPASSPMLQLPIPALTRTLWLGPVWNFTYFTIMSSRKQQRGNRISGFWSPQIIFGRVPKRVDGRDDERDLLLYQYLQMSFDPSTGAPIANAVGSFVTSRFFEMLRAALPSENPEEEGFQAFLVDANGQVLSASHVTRPFTTIYLNTTGGKVWKGCNVFGGFVMGCFYNTSDYAPYQLLHVALTSPIYKNWTLYKNSPEVFSNLISTSSSTTESDDDLEDLEEQFSVFKKELNLDAPGLTITVFLMFPLKKYLAPITHARRVTIAIVVVVSLVGAIIIYFVIRRSTSSIHDLVEKMKDPFQANLKTTPSSSSSFDDDSNNKNSNNNSSALLGIEGEENENQQQQLQQASENSQNKNEEEKDSVLDYLTKQLQICWNYVEDYFSGSEETAKLQAEFDAFKTVILQLRGFLAVGEKHLHKNKNKSSVNNRKLQHIKKEKNEIVSKEKQQQQEQKEKQRQKQKEETSKQQQENEKDSSVWSASNSSRKNISNSDSKESGISSDNNTITNTKNNNNNHSGDVLGPSILGFINSGSSSLTTPTRKKQKKSVQFSSVAVNHHQEEEDDVAADSNNEASSLELAQQQQNDDDENVRENNNNKKNKKKDTKQKKNNISPLLNVGGFVSLTIPSSSDDDTTNNNNNNNNNRPEIFNLSGDNNNFSSSTSGRSSRIPRNSSSLSLARVPKKKVRTGHPVCFIGVVGFSVMLNHFKFFGSSSSSSSNSNNNNNNNNNTINESNKRLIDFSIFLAEQVSMISKSVGSILCDFNADFLIVISQVRNSMKKTKIPTRFCILLNELAEKIFNFVKKLNPKIQFYSGEEEEEEEEEERDETAATSQSLRRSPSLTPTTTNQKNNNNNSSNNNKTDDFFCSSSPSSSSDTRISPVVLTAGVSLGRCRIFSATSDSFSNSFSSSSLSGSSNIPTYYNNNNSDSGSLNNKGGSGVRRTTSNVKFSSPVTRIDSSLSASPSSVAACSSHSSPSLSSPSSSFPTAATTFIRPVTVFSESVSEALVLERHARYKNLEDIRNLTVKHCICFRTVHFPMFVTVRGKHFGSLEKPKQQQSKTTHNNDDSIPVSRLLHASFN